MQEQIQGKPGFVSVIGEFHLSEFYLVRSSGLLLQTRIKRLNSGE